MEKQFPQSFESFTGNYAETTRFHKTFILEN